MAQCSDTAGAGDPERREEEIQAAITRALAQLPDFEEVRGHSSAVERCGPHVDISPAMLRSSNLPDFEEAVVKRELATLEAVWASEARVAGEGLLQRAEESAATAAAQEGSGEQQMLRSVSTASHVTV